MSMFIPDDAHRRRVADAVEQATDTGSVTLTLSADEAANLHTAAVTHYRQVREELDQHTRNMILATLQVLDEATKAARAAQEAQSRRHWRFIEQSIPVLRDDLGLQINPSQAAGLLGMLSAGAPVDYIVGRVVGRLAELAGRDDLGDEHATYQAAAKRLVVIYKETQTVKS